MRLPPSVLNRRYSTSNDQCYSFYTGMFGRRMFVCQMAVASMKCPHNALRVERACKAIYCVDCKRRWVKERLAISPGGTVTISVFHDEKDCRKTKSYLESIR